VIQTESEDEGLDGAHYRRLWRTQCQNVRGWKRKHEMLLDKHNWLRARYADMEKRKDEAVFFAYFLKAQSHYLRFKGEKIKILFRILFYFNYLFCFIEPHPKFLLALEIPLKIFWSFYNSELKVVESGVSFCEEASPFERPEGELAYLARCASHLEKLGFLIMKTGENPTITAACFQSMQLDISIVPPPCKSKETSSAHFRQHQFVFLSHLNTILAVRSSLAASEEPYD